MKEKSLIENFKNLLYTKLWSEFILSRVTGDECEMARCLLEPRVCFWEPAVLIFSKVSRKGVNIHHLVEAKAKLNRTYLTRRGTQGKGNGVGRGGGARFLINTTFSFFTCDGW